MPIELDIDRTSKLVDEIVVKSTENKLVWKATDQSFSTSVGPVNVYIFRVQPGPGWTTMHAALDGQPLFNILNPSAPGIQPKSEYATPKYRRNVDLITTLVSTFDSEIRESQFAKAFEALSSL